MNVSSQTIQALVKNDVCRIEEETVYRSPIKIDKPEDSKVVLSDEQKKIIEDVKKI